MVIISCVGEIGVGKAGVGKMGQIIGKMGTSHIINVLDVHTCSGYYITKDNVKFYR